MKLEYIEDINGYDEHAVRLSDFDSAQANTLRDVINQVIADKKEIELTTLDFIELLNCKLTLRISEEDLGISTTDYVIFFCDLTVGSYKNTAKLLEPFCRKESRGYQWLYDLDTPIGFLLSAGQR